MGCSPKPHHAQQCARWGRAAAAVEWGALLPAVRKRPQMLRGFPSGPSTGPSPGRGPGFSPAGCARGPQSPPTPPQLLQPPRKPARSLLARSPVTRAGGGARLPPHLAPLPTPRKAAPWPSGSGRAGQGRGPAFPRETEHILWVKINQRPPDGLGWACRSDLPARRLASLAQASPAVSPSPRPRPSLGSQLLPEKRTAGTASNCSPIAGWSGSQTGPSPRSKPSPEREPAF